MEKILVLNSGGTFNKVYNPISGKLDVSQNNKTIETIIDTAFKGNLNIQVQGCVFKDSLDLSTLDRKEFVKIMEPFNLIVLIHGTDTMDVTAKYLQSNIKNKTVVLTGSMEPFSINTIEATANLSQAIQFISTVKQHGIFISMHGLAMPFEEIKKNRTLGIFECQK